MSFTLFNKALVTATVERRAEPLAKSQVNVATLALASLNKLQTWGELAAQSVGESTARILLITEYYKTERTVIKKKT